MQQVNDINIVATKVLPSPASLRETIAKDSVQTAFVADSRQQIHNIIFGNDPRLLVVVGPCSIHDVEAGREYASRLVKLADELKEQLYLVMRVYYEKPRTTVGWKGLIMDPHLDGSYDIPEGLRLARNFLRDIIDMGLPTATELLDPITPQYIADLISWSAIGARTTESQTHRQMASGLSMPLGFKNGTDGSIQVAINAIKAASQQQTFLGVNQDGAASAVTTRGNPSCHIVLRGGSSGSNYSAEAIEETASELTANGLRPAIMVDCSHGNSDKDPSKQPQVLAQVAEQIAAGNSSIIGVMVESNLKAGNQPFPQPRENLVFGQSITDGCIDFETTEASLRATADAVKKGRLVAN